MYTDVHEESESEVDKKPNVRARRETYRKTPRNSRSNCLNCFLSQLGTMKSEFDEISKIFFLSASRTFLNPPGPPQI